MTGAHIYYRTAGQIVKGRVIALERSKSLTRKGQESQEIYRPLYEYLFNGLPVRFFGMGSNYIFHQVGDEVEILSLKRGPTFCQPQTRLNYYFIFFMYLFGFTPLTMAWFKSPTPSVFYISLCFIILFHFIIILVLLSSNRLQDVVDGFLKQTTLETEESLKTKDLIWVPFTPPPNRSQNSSSIFTAILFLFFSIGMSLFFWNELPSQHKETIYHLSITTSNNQIQRIISHRYMIGFIVFLFFSFISILHLTSRLKNPNQTMMKKKLE